MGALSFVPKSDKELAEALLLPEGAYDFEVAKAIVKASKSGNPMMEVGLKIWDEHGATTYVYDYLMTNNIRMEFKIKNFCKALGLIDKYESGTIEETDCVGKCGKVLINISKDKNNQYPDKNSVKNYVESESSVNNTKKTASTIEDDDIPF